MHVCTITICTNIIKLYYCIYYCNVSLGWNKYVNGQPCSSACCKPFSVGRC